MQCIHASMIYHKLKSFKDYPVLVPAMGRDPNRSFLQHGQANMFFPLLNLVNEIEEMDKTNAFGNHETKVNEPNRNGKSNKIIVTLMA